MARYCLCRSEKSSGFMIQCERCGEWFHGKCVSISSKAAKNIDLYFCGQCSKLFNLSTTYKHPESVVTNKPTTEQELLPVKQEPLEERKQERKAPEITPSPISVSVRLPPPPKTQRKTTVGRRKGPKANSKAPSSIQCAHPDCTKASRQSTSKYCSDDCGYKLNKWRYDTFFRPKYAALSENHSIARLERMKEIARLETEKADVERLIENLKEEKREVGENIRIIKEQAQKMYDEHKKVEKKDESTSKNDDAEEYLTGDSSKTFCITCGMAQQRTQIFKHWLTCHRKHEDTYNLSAPNKSHSGEGEDPKIFCDVFDKKTNSYCRHLESACPIHVNWLADKDEVCGCPLNIMQKLVPDGNYCLELKKDCTTHYHWDRFRLANINMLRIQAYGKLETNIQKYAIVENQLLDTYGGVVGVMLHNTIDHKETKAMEIAEENNDDTSNLMVDDI